MLAVKRQHAPVARCCVDTNACLCTRGVFVLNSVTGQGVFCVGTSQRLFKEICECPQGARHCKEQAGSMHVSLPPCTPFHRAVYPAVCPAVCPLYPVTFSVL